MNDRTPKTYIVRYGLLEQTCEVSDLEKEVSATYFRQAVHEATRWLREEYGHDDSVKDWDIQSVSLAPWEQPWI